MISDTLIYGVRTPKLFREICGLYMGEKWTRSTRIEVSGLRISRGHADARRTAWVDGHLGSMVNRMTSRRSSYTIWSSNYPTSQGEKGERRKDVDGRIVALS